MFHYRAYACVVCFVIIVLALFTLSMLVPPAIARPWDVPADKIKIGPDVVGNKELAAVHDPTFDSVASHFPMLSIPEEAIGVPEGILEFTVLPYGELLLNNLSTNRLGQPESYDNAPAAENKAILYFLLGKGDTKTRYGQDNSPDSKHLVDGYLPMVIVPFTSEKIEYQQTIFAWSPDMDPDARLWAYISLKMKNPTDTTICVELAYEAEYGARRCHITLDSWKYLLQPGESKQLCLRIPRDGIVHDNAISKNSPEFKKRAYNARLPFCGGFQGVEIVEPAEYDRCFKEASQKWRNLLNKGTKICVPEPRINNAYRAWLAYTFLNVDKEGDRYFPHDGSNFYEMIWGLAAIQYCRALDAYGYSKEAQRYLDSIYTLVQPDGELKTCFGLSDSGVLLMASEDHYLFTRNLQWLSGAAPIIERVCNWSIARRAKEKKEQKPDSATWGLIRYRPSGDYPEPDYSFLSDTTLCAGLEAAARVLTAAGQEEAAKRIAMEAAAYRHDIDKAMRRAVFDHKGTELLPVLPASRRWLIKAHYGTTGYYSLFASLLLDNEFLAADDPHAIILSNTLEKCGGLTAGTCNFLNSTDECLISHGFTYGYWLQMLKHNRPKKAILGLYASMAYGMSRNTYSSVEVTNIGTGENMSRLPHLRSGTQQLRLLRSMLIREDGDCLILGQAAPQHWFESGQRIEVLDAPTVFGTMSYTVESDTDRGIISVRVIPPNRSTPQKIQLYVRHPENKRICTVLCDGKPITSFNANSVTLRDLDETISLELHYD